MKKWFVICSLFIIVGCSDQPRQVVDSPFEPIRFKDDRAQSIKAQDHMVDFIYMAEKKLKEPFQQSRKLENGNVVFPKKFVRKEQLLQYAELYLSMDLAARWVEEVVNGTESRPGEYLAIATDTDDISIYDAEPGSIKIIQNSTLLTTVIMTVKEDNKRYSLQYVIKKDQRGTQPKIMQKLLQD
jgi:hypothetical protein